MSKIYLLSNSIVDGATSLPVIDINYLDFEIDLSKYDALIFTSKNSVIALKNNPHWKNIDSFAISEQTAKLIQKEGGKLVYTGSSRDGNEFAKEILPLIKTKKVLYLRAKEVVSDLVSILKENQIDLDEQIVYETVCKEYKNKEFENDSVFIFTSPSTVECFFKSFDWKPTYKAVTIGTTTAKALPNDIKYYISKEKSIISCIELAKELCLEKTDNCKNCDSEVKKGIRLCPECGELNPTLKNSEIWKIIAIILAIGAVVSVFVK